MAKICSACGKENLAGTLMCARCGNMLPEDSTAKPLPVLGDNTKSVTIDHPDVLNSPEAYTSLSYPDPNAPINASNDHPHSMPPDGNPRTAHIDQLNTANMAIYVGRTEKPLIVPLTDRVSLGRNAGSQMIHPTVDLTNYGAYEKGVSRVHAIVRRTENGLTIEDQGSSNGSWLNGSRLKPYVPAPLAPGDRIDLSQVALEVHFIVDSAPANKAAGTQLEAERAAKVEGRQEVGEASLEVQREGREAKPQAADTESVTPIPANDAAFRFQGRFVLDNDQFDEQLHMLVRDIVDQLRSVKNCDVNVTIEVNARSNEPIDPDVRKAIYDASARLNTLISEFRTK